MATRQEIRDAARTHAEQDTREIFERGWLKVALLGLSRERRESFRTAAFRFPPEQRTDFADAVIAERRLLLAENRRNYGGLRWRLGLSRLIEEPSMFRRILREAVGLTGRRR